MKQRLAIISSLLCAHTVCALPLELSLDKGSALTWHTVAGKFYQPQWADLQGSAWVDFGERRMGDGYPRSLLDADGADRYYRIVEITPATTQRIDVLTNGSFEIGSGSMAEEWTTTGNIHTRDDADARSGSFSHRAFIENDGTIPNSGLLIQRTTAGAVVPNGTYILSFWFKQISYGPSYVQYYEVQWVDDSGSTVSSTGYLPIPAGSGSWQQVISTEWTAPVNAVDAKVVFLFSTGNVEGGNGGVLVDDVELSTQTGVTPVPEQVRYNDVETSPVLIVSWPTSYGVYYWPKTSSRLLDPSWTLHGTYLGDGSTRPIVIPATNTHGFFLVESIDLSHGGISNIMPIFNASTPPEPAVSKVTSNALITRVADRARDRHAREDIVNGFVFRKYDHYLPFYWEQRIANMEIIDRVAMGGTGVTFNFTTQAQLNPAEFRTFYGNTPAVAQYYNNMSDYPGMGVTLYSIEPSARYPGETNYNYTATIVNQFPENHPLEIGDRIEVELSQFLLNPRNGRENYYGTAFLYVVGEGVVPWYAKYKEEAADSNAWAAASFDSYPLPEAARLGGRTTLPYQYSNEPQHRFKQMAGNISPHNSYAFMFGRRLHHTDFQTGAHSEAGNPPMTEHALKVGPRFSAASCVDCHINNGRSLPPAPGSTIIESIVKVGSDVIGSPHPALGKQLQPLSTIAVPEGAAVLSGYTYTTGFYGDGTAYELRKPVYTFEGPVPEYHSVRAAPPLVGMGLLEAVDEMTIALRADPDDADEDGISGRLSVVPDPADSTRLLLGRFGHKASQAKVSHQIAAAFNGDMGITTSLLPVQDGGTDPEAAELSDHELDQITRYIALLGVSARRSLTATNALRGEALFEAASCTKCHVPEMTTGSWHPMAELRNQTIRPFTDLLVHDMGPGLADSMGENGVSGSEWRTAPLWNIGLTEGVSGGEAYLHDGRARTLEEAILWHGGEAEAAKEYFRTLPQGDREAIIAFIHSL